MATGGINLTTQAGNNRVYLFRLQMLIIDGGLLVLRNILDLQLTHQGLSFVAWLNQERAIIKHLRIRRTITQDQYDILFPQGRPILSTSDIDITLIICLLRNFRCFGLNKAFDWSKQPATTDQTLEADICRLKHHRNNISHISTTTGIQHSDFIIWWKDIELLLIRQSSQALNITHKIADLKSCPLDPEEEKRLQKTIKSWKKYESDVDQLKGEMKNIKEDVSDIKEKVNNYSKDARDLKQNYSGVEVNISNLTKDVSGINTGMISMMEDVNDLTKDFRSLEQSCCNMKGDLEEVKRKKDHADNSNKEKRKHRSIWRIFRPCRKKKEADTNIEKWCQAIDQSTTRLKKNLIPEPIIDCCTDFELFSFKDRRDIKEKMTTTEKIDDISSIVKSKGFAGYSDFKRRLYITNQSKLAEFLSCKEHGLDTRHIEKELDKIAKTPLPSNEYLTRKNELKENLIKYYKDRQSTIPLSPLVEEVETHLAGFYVMPDMDLVVQKCLTSDQEERTPVKSLRDIFDTGSDDKQKIYLSADAGFGKTAFSKYLAIAWSQASWSDDDKKCFKDEELKALAKYDFLFLVLLRDSTGVCYIDEMIEQQIIKRLPPLSPQFSLQEVLRREKCLIILDGLDEWTHPDNGCSDQKEKVPHRYARENCTILTTTRPWKLGVSNLKSNDINKKVELVQLCEESISQLEKNAIRKMSGVENAIKLKRKTQAFKKIINDRGLKHMQTIPLLLMYIICLWCNKIPIGDSKVEVYINIIEFLLSRTTQKHPEIHPSSESSPNDIPAYFKKHDFCQRFYSLLTTLSNLAYHALFNEKRENTLVFDRSVAEQYLNKDDMKLSLLSGILTRSTTTTLMERLSKVSFSHKTVQEFFAAIFISSQSDAQKTVLEKCKTVQNIFDMSLICEFISKMNSIMMNEITHGFMSVINADEDTCSYRTRTVAFSDPLYNLQKMILSYLKEMPEMEVKLCLQDFFLDRDEAIFDKHLQYLSKLNKANMKSLKISVFNISISLHKIIDLFSLTDLNNLQKLDFNGGLKSADIGVLLFPSLETITLWKATWTNNAANLDEKLEKLNYLQYVNIKHITFCHEMLDILFNFMSGKNTLKEVKLGTLFCKEHGSICKRKFDLSKNSQLTKLVLDRLPPLQINLSTSSLVHVDLTGINLGESSLLMSRNMLNIECVTLENIEIPAASFQNIVDSVQDLPQSVTIEMCKCDIKPETEYKRVRDVIRSSQSFDVICDNDDQRFDFKTKKS